MSVTAASGEEESFIILGSSPGASLLQAGAGAATAPAARDSGPEALKISDVMKEFSGEGSLAFKAHFNLDNDNPSSTSMLLASSMVSEAGSALELQRKLGELLDENVILRETLRANNSSLKERFLMIASCQEDMMRTHKVHKDKFQETKRLIEKLRSDNRKLKEEVKLMHEGPKSASSAPGSPPAASLTETAVSAQSDPAGGASEANGSLAYEFVTSPDEDTLQKLTSQLELVERQRRQVIAENEKLTWQKESLEHMVDVTSKERDRLRDQLHAVQLESSTKERELAGEAQGLRVTVKDLQTRLQQSESLGSVETEEMLKRDNAIHLLEGKVSALQEELKNAQLKIFDMENLKLEISRLKHGGAETARVYRDQLQQLQARLKEAQTTVFQPVRFSISVEAELEGSEYAQYSASVKVYDKALKHLADLLNTIAAGSCENLSHAQHLAVQASELRAEQVTPEQVRGTLAQLRGTLDAQHTSAQATTGQVRATISIFEKIFQDYKDVLKNLIDSKTNQSGASATSMDALAAALMSRDQELRSCEEEVSRLRCIVTSLQRESDERDHLRAQMDVYKADFEAERASREKLASDKDTVMSDLRNLQSRNQEITQHLEEVRKLNPNIFLQATSKRPHRTPRTTSGATATTTTTATAGPATGTGNMARSSDGTAKMVYTCPKCNAFSCHQYKVIEDHVQMCLDL